ncbi:hypothetical protein F5B20DRAFT_320137 [Whalleya microplaca]|nr:hypothetical protein F5B20DRAFT_320137 [Whalleya microplaca]
MRVSKFVEAMSEIDKLVTIFLNVSSVVAFVWGPIKLVLMAAASKVETLECLLDTYAKVGEVIPSLQQYDQLFKNAPAVLEVLERFFVTFLNSIKARWKFLQGQVGGHYLTRHGRRSVQGSDRLSKVSSATELCC